MNTFQPHVNSLIGCFHSRSQGEVTLQNTDAHTANIPKNRHIKSQIIGAHYVPKRVILRIYGILQRRKNIL